MEKSEKWKAIKEINKNGQFPLSVEVAPQQRPGCLFSTESQKACV